MFTLADIATFVAVAGIVIGGALLSANLLRERSGVGTLPRLAVTGAWLALVCGGIAAVLSFLQIDD